MTASARVSLPVRASVAPCRVRLSIAASLCFSVLPDSASIALAPTARPVSAGLSPLLVELGRRLMLFSVASHSLMRLELVDGSLSPLSAAVSATTS